MSTWIHKQHIENIHYGKMCNLWVVQFCQWGRPFFHTASNWSPCSWIWTSWYILLCFKNTGLTQVWNRIICTVSDWDYTTLNFGSIFLTMLSIYHTTHKHKQKPIIPDLDVMSYKFKSVNALTGIKCLGKTWESIFIWKQ